MDIEMLNKFLKVVISAVILAASGYANNASADFVETELSQTTFDWSATCYDCKIGNPVNEIPADPTLWKGVTGSITLSDYTLGDAITSANFISFAYTGVSQFLPMFTIGKEEGYDFSLSQVSGTLYANADLTLELVALDRSTHPIEPIYPEPLTLDAIIEGYDADYRDTYYQALMACEDARDKFTCFDDALSKKYFMIAEISKAEDLITKQANEVQASKLKYELEVVAWSLNTAPIEPLYPDPFTLDAIIENYDADYEGTIVSDIIRCDGANFYDDCYNAARAKYNLMIAEISNAKNLITKQANEVQATKLKYELALAAYIGDIQLSITPQDWSFGGFNAEKFDIGKGFSIIGLSNTPPVNQVSAPATLAIFALGLMGLGLRRFKKQS
jgi:hypothetical protein